MGQVSFVLPFYLLRTFPDFPFQVFKIAVVIRGSCGELLAGSPCAAGIKEGHAAKP